MCAIHYSGIGIPVCCVYTSWEDSEFIQDADRDRSIPFKVWVPDADNHKGPLPLVLLSHGSGGEHANHGWLIDALLGGGVVVERLTTRTIRPGTILTKA